MHEQTEFRGPSHASVFIWLFAIASIWHYTSSAGEIASYWFRYDPQVTPLILLSLVSAFVVACYPNKVAALLFFSSGQLLAIFIRFPFVADHLVMELFLHLSILLSFAYLAITRKTLKIATTEMFDLFSPVGRWLLIIMYFYGTFHKINPGFLSLSSSCAVPFISGLPLPASLSSQGWFQYAAIYGTLILESIAMVLLFSARTKYFGMLLGMSFHFIIGISTFGTLAHFSAFALALHTLFLPSSFGERIYQERLLPAFAKTSGNFKGVTIAFVTLQILLAIHLVTTRQGYLVNALFTAFGITMLFLVFKYGQLRSIDAPYRLKSAMLAMNLIPVWYFLHCLSPYVGLGTGGALTMFSGLRTEGGVSNHYIIRKPIPLFSYQDKIVYPEEAASPSLAAAASDGQGVVLFDFQRHFTSRENFSLPMRLRIGDDTWSIDTVDELRSFAGEQFSDQSWLARKYMSFRLVDDPQPNRCRH